MACAWVRDGWPLLDDPYRFDAGRVRGFMIAARFHSRGSTADGYSSNRACSSRAVRSRSKDSPSNMRICSTRRLDHLFVDPERLEPVSLPGSSQASRPHRAASRTASVWPRSANPA